MELLIKMVFKNKNNAITTLLLIWLRWAPLWYTGCSLEIRASADLLRMNVKLS